MRKLLQQTLDRQTQNKAAQPALPFPSPPIQITQPQKKTAQPALPFPAPPIQITRPPADPSAPLHDPAAGLPAFPDSGDPGLRIVPAEEAESAEETIPHTFNFPNSPLEPIFEMFTELTGKMVLYSPNVTGTINLISGSVELSRTEAIEAITSSLALSDIILIPLGEKFVKAVLIADAVKHAPKINHFNPEQLPESGEFITRIVELNQVKPSEVVDVLKPLVKIPEGLIPFDASQTLMICSDAVTMKQLLKVLKSIDVAPEFDNTIEVIPIRYSQVGALYNTIDTLIQGGGMPASSDLTAANQPSSIGGGRFGQGSIGGFGGRFGQGSSYGGGYGGGYGSGYRPFQANRTQTSTASNRSNFQDRLNKIVRKASEEEEVELLSQARIVPDEHSNSLLVFANRHDLNMITNLVSKVDRLLAQVLIEAIIMEIGLSDSMNLGVSFSQQPETRDKWSYGGALATSTTALRFGNDFLSGSLTNAFPEGFNYFGKYNDTLQAAVNAIARDSNNRVISRPRIQTSHAVTGIFFLGESVPYASGTSIGYYQGGNQTVVRELSIGIGLEVTPYITPEGYIVMQISQTVDDRGQDVVIDGNPIPSVNQRQATAVLSVRDGDTIMLGGFIRQTKNNSKSGVPLLKDLPLLGGLFRSKSNDSQRTEMIILLRATVLETPEEAALVASQERENIDGIREMEKDFEAERRGKKKKRLRLFQR